MLSCIFAANVKNGVLPMQSLTRMGSVYGKKCEEKGEQACSLVAFVNSLGYVLYCSSRLTRIPLALSRETYLYPANLRRGRICAASVRYFRLTSIKTLCGDNRLEEGCDHPSWGLTGILGKECPRGTH